jgi:hypothetical protein
MKHLRRAVRMACALASLLLLAACGGSSSSAPQPVGQIQGIATPSSIAVVTATNAE